jgi:hypothetical protein
MYTGARVSSISTIFFIGDGLNPSLLYPPLEEEGGASSISTIITEAT